MNRMKRRDFGLLAGTSLAAATLVQPARAQAATPDPNLLDTTLTPLGAERAGNAFTIQVLRNLLRRNAGDEVTEDSLDGPCLFRYDFAFSRSDGSGV